MAKPQLKTEINVQDLRDEELVKLANMVLKELDHRLSHGLQYLGMYRNCSITLTWVKNKVGRKYWYYYFKCRSGKPRSVYLGNKSELMRYIQRVKSIQHELRIALRISKLINELSVWMSHIPTILVLTKKIEEQVKE